jgi:hypothetical protein
MTNQPFIYTRTAEELNLNREQLPESVVVDDMRFYRQINTPYKPRTAAVAVYATMSGAFVLELR